MQWSEVLENPVLANLPFKIERNKFGKLLMSPASNNHGRLQYAVGRRIEKGNNNGVVIMECSIDTLDGVKVADVVWASDEFIENHGYQTPYDIAPEICVEIISSSNTDAEMQEKIQLYLAKGAKEVWICNSDGVVSFYSHAGKQARSLQVI